MTVIAYRTHWTKTYLKQAGLVMQPRRGMVMITELGRACSLKNPTKINNAVPDELTQSFVAFKEKGTAGIRWKHVILTAT